MTTTPYIYQHGTLGGLMQGFMEGTETIGALLEKGDFGLGTLEGVNGEVIILDGIAYQADETGKVNRLNGQETTPYTAVTQFNAQKSVEVSNESSEETKNGILAHISPNLFAAVKIKGTFSSMHVRVAPKQQAPYPLFVEIARNQPEFRAENVAGTIVGFYTPALFHGASAAGFHLHFISDDETFGGHILDFELKEGKIEEMALPELRQHFPMNNPNYLEKEIDLASVGKDIEEAE